jgi:phenylacetate-CoA ligase
MTSYHDEQETQHHEQRMDRHNDLLTRMCRRGCATSPYIEEVFAEYGLTADDITAVNDLEKLPIISREQLVSLESGNPPYGGLAASDLMPDRIFTSPGPVYEPHLSEGSLWSRGYQAAGFGKGDIVLNTFSYHMVAAGLTFHEGLRSVGATVVPSGTSSTDIQVQLLRDLKVTAYTGTPSFLMAIIAKAEEQGIDVKSDTALRRACFVAEPLQPSLRVKFEEEYGIDTYQMYGATEVGDIAYECVEKNGWHLCEEVIVEIVDPETGRNVEQGQWGEVVVTRLNDLFFLFRFATGDLSRFMEGSCRCGRTSRRLDGIAGRVGDAAKVRGLFIAPSQLTMLRQQFEGIFFRLVITRQEFRDHLKILLASHEVIHPAKIERFVKSFRDLCSIRPDDVEVIDMAVLESSPVLISDHREWR